MRTIAIPLAALALLSPVLPAYADSGSIVCERDLARAERLFEQKRDRLSPAEARQIEQRLALAPTYCAANSYPSSVTLSGLDQIRQRLDAVPQVAEVPSNGSIGTD